MYKLVWLNEQEYSAVQHKYGYLKSFGDHNTLPEPFNLIDVNEYIHKNFMWCPEYEEMRNIINNEGYNGQYHIRFYHNYAIGVREPQKWKLDGDKIVYSENFRYLYIGCQHYYQELSVAKCRELKIDYYGQCYHVYKCMKCGSIYSTDSSD